MKRNLTPSALLKKWKEKYPSWRRALAGILIVSGAAFFLMMALAASQLLEDARDSRQTAATTLEELEALLLPVPDAAFSRQDTLAVGEDDLFQTINPLYSTGDGELDAADLIFEPLVRIGENGDPVPVLAESWNYSAADHRLTFILRKDHTFEDGRVVDASDVLFTYKCLLNSSYDGPLRGWLDEIASVEAGPDASTIIFTTADRVESPDFRPYTCGILKADYYQYNPDQIFIMAEENPAPKGSGPFTLTSVSKKQAVLTRRTGYGGSIRQIRLLQVDSEDKYSMLVKGKLDIVRNLWDARMKQRVNSLKGYDFYPFSTSVDSYFLVNPEPKPSNIIQRPSQRLAVLLAVAGRPLSDLQKSALQELTGHSMVLYFFRGVDDSVWAENSAKAQQFADALKVYDLPVEIKGTDWPDLIKRTIDGTYDLLLLPATVNSRLPDNAVLLSDMIWPDASAWITGCTDEVYIVSNRLAQVTINPLGHPYAASAGTWTDRIENILIYNKDGSYWEPASR